MTMTVKKGVQLRKDGKQDGRFLNKTGRTVQFATRTTAEFKERVDKIREREGIMLAVLLEEAIECYERRGRLADLKAKYLQAKPATRKSFVKWLQKREEV